MTESSRRYRIRPTIVDVAKRANVSVGTASRVINGFSNVRPELRAKVRAAISELDYRPNTTAQDMRRGHTRLIGIVVRDITVPALAQYVKSAQDVLHGAGYSVLIASSDNETEREQALLDTLSQRRVDGLITSVASEKDAGLSTATQSLGVPVVLLDRDGLQMFDAVKVDHHEGIRRAVEQLLVFGHRRIALLPGQPIIWPANARILGYEAAHSAHGVPVDRELIYTDGFSQAFAARVTTSLLTADSAVTAIVAGGIDMLPGVLQAIGTQGRRVPEDISVVSGSDSDLAALVSPSITAVRWDSAAVGAAAAYLLLDRLQKQTTGPPRRLSIPTELVIRSSSAPAAAAIGIR